MFFTVPVLRDWTTFVWASVTNLPGAVVMMGIWLTDDQTTAVTSSVTRLQSMILVNGDGGVSSIASAWGWKSRSIVTLLARRLRLIDAGRRGETFGSTGGGSCCNSSTVTRRAPVADTS